LKKLHFFVIALPYGLNKFLAIVKESFGFIKTDLEAEKRWNGSQSQAKRGSPIYLDSYSIAMKQIFDSR
jgi:hypothetical protein